jgi:DNA-binding CsgD family transcriptional regulator
VSPGSARSLMKLGFQIDWESVLPDIHVPTVVMHRAGDLVVPIRQARRLADGIAGARFVQLPGIDHLMWAGDQDAIIAELRAFLDDVGLASTTSSAPGPDLGLTPREKEVLALVAKGLTNRQIAAELFISVKTAGAHVSNILTKLGVARRAQAAAVAERLRLSGDRALAG